MTGYSVPATVTCQTLKRVWVALHCVVDWLRLAVLGKQIRAWWRVQRRKSCNSSAEEQIGPESQLSHL